MNSRRSKRLNSSNERDGKGKFKKTCGALTHSSYNDSQFSLINLQKRKKIKFSDYTTLIEQGIITFDAKFICQPCSKSIQNESNTELNDSSVADEEQECDDLVLRSYELGTDLSSIILPDIVKLYNSMSIAKEIDTLIKHKPLNWLSNRPQESVHLLAKICQIDLNTATDRKLLIIEKIIELIYFSRNSKLILPQHFLENLMSYSLTNCKTFSNFMGSRSPGGTHTYLSSWLSQQANEPIDCPAGIIKAVFDNNQKIGKTYLITGDNIVPSIVMTSNLWITFNPTSTLQNEEQFKNDFWMWTDKEINSDELINVLTEPGAYFRESKDELIGTCIDTVYKQHSKQNGECSDHVDVSISTQN